MRSRLDRGAFQLFLSQHEQLVRLADDDLLSAAFDQPSGFPGAERPAHRMQGGAGHLRDVLPADREVDLDAMVDLASGLVDQP